MLKPKKKITRKEIKQDQLVTAYAKMTSFYETNKKLISYGVTALVLIIIGIVIYTNNRKANDDKAATELGKVYAIYDAATGDITKYKLAIDGQPERGIIGLKAIVDNYGGTTSGQLARYYLATAYYNLGNYDEALKCFDAYSGSSDLLNAAAVAGVGKCLEAKGDYIKAAGKFENAARIVSDNTNTPDYLNSAAKCYGMGGEKEKAVSILKRIKKEYPRSQYGRDADRAISQFST
jgi:TolA-binding protein